MWNVSHFLCVVVMREAIKASKASKSQHKENKSVCPEVGQLSSAVQTPKIRFSVS